jgi:hypothetical protein
LVDQKLEMAFAFEIKDGTRPTWGMLTRDGAPKPRYFGLKLLNVLGPRRLLVRGEGTYVKALASRDAQKTSLILVNYDPRGINNEIVPVVFSGLVPDASYTVRQRNLKEEESVVLPASSTGTLSRLVTMGPNAIVAVELMPE